MSVPLLYHYPGSICSQMARLALCEKAVTWRTQVVDIMETSEQFEPWYVALNPNAVVPTLVHDGRVVTDTKRIVAHVDADFDGPALSEVPEAEMRGWLEDIMGLHYGVLLYRRRMGPDGALPPQIVERGALLRRLAGERPALAPLIARRIGGNDRFQALLRDPEGIAAHVDAARALVGRMAAALEDHRFLAGKRYSLADCFATAVLARFRIHGFEDWWAGGPVERYYAVMRARPSFAAAGVVDTGSEADL